MAIRPVNQGQVTVRWDSQPLGGVVSSSPKVQDAPENKWSLIEIIKAPLRSLANRVLWFRNPQCPDEAISEGTLSHPVIVEWDQEPPRSDFRRENRNVDEVMFHVTERQFMQNAQSFRTMPDLLLGIVVQTKARTLLGRCFYSDKDHYDGNSIPPEHVLNRLAKVSLIGIAAGVIRAALATIHIVGHLFAAILNIDKGHLFHAAKGVCELLKGVIEATPFVGRKFAEWYSKEGEWWGIKIYNPDSPDSLDEFAKQWNAFRESRPSGYIVA